MKSDPSGHATEFTKDIATAAGEAAVQLKDYGSQKMQDARQVLADTRAAVGERASTAAGAANSYAHDHPWGLLMLAGGLGLIAGLLMARR